MMLLKTTGLAAALLLCLGLSGCYEKETVRWHEPGKYLGQQDPLLQVSGSAERESKLAERFKSIQTDR